MPGVWFRDSISLESRALRMTFGNASYWCARFSSRLLLVPMWFAATKVIFNFLFDNNNSFGTQSASEGYEWFFTRDDADH